MKPIVRQRFNPSGSSPIVKRVIRFLLDLLSNHKEDLTAKERFLLEYIQLVAQYRLAFISKRDTVFFWSPIELRAQVGKKLGFSEEEIRDIASFVRDSYETEEKLDRLIRFISEQLGEKSK